MKKNKDEKQIVIIKVRLNLFLQVCLLSEEELASKRLQKLEETRHLVHLHLHLHLQAHQDLKNLILGLCHLRHLKVREDKVVARVEEEQLTKSVKPIINLNAFIILVEKIRVGIAVVIVAIADNTLYSSIHLKNILNILPNIKQNI